MRESMGCQAWKHQENEVMRMPKFAQESTKKSKEGDDMIADLIALFVANFLAISAAGIFWSGSFDSSEKKERRRVARLIGRKYPRTY